MLQILENCYQRNSVIATSQFPVSKWYDYINEPTLADAIMDRLTANAVRIVLKGDSMRRKNQKKIITLSNRKRPYPKWHI